MNKKFLGIRVGAIFTLFLCLLAAFLIWLYVGIISNNKDISTEEAKNETEDTVWYDSEFCEVL